MSKNEIFDKVITILKRYTKNDDALTDVSTTTDILEDLQVNSARLVDVILDFEDAFDIEIGDEDADRVTTVGDALQLVEARIG
ncbi:MAG: acyl carrier protein [Deltaproteobacteria bacterium]|nr:acyl carrier protein [Deltaproteobacteria bacterium]